MAKFFSALFMGILALFSGAHPAAVTTSNTQNPSTNSVAQVTVTQDQISSMGSNIYADGNLPLGDKKYSLTGPKKGYVYLCQLQQGGGGAYNVGPWVSTTTWNYKQKPAVSGHVVWSQARFSNTISGSTRILSGNDLPVDGYTGTFPIQSTNAAYQYDRNPNSISAQNYSLSLPVSPTYQDTPSCMGGEVGVMLNGVALFNGFDAEYRDAAAHELQDSCDGHPQENGEYHYHSLSSCFTNINETNVLGFALDGFPITGPEVSSGKYLTTNDLDECHGITSTIMLDGKQVTMYHYVMTQDFPYSVSCFRGKPVQMQVIQGKVQGGSNKNGNPSTSLGQVPSQNSGQVPQGSGQPPQAAISACSNKSTGASCSFTSPNGTVSGSCQTPPGQNSTVCVPRDRLP